MQRRAADVNFAVDPAKCPNTLAFLTFNDTAYTLPSVPVSPDGLVDLLRQKWRRYEHSYHEPEHGPDHSHDRL